MWIENHHQFHGQVIYEGGEKQNHKTYENWIESWNLTYFSQDDAKWAKMMKKVQHTTILLQRYVFMHLKKIRFSRWQLQERQASNLKVK